MKHCALYLAIVVLVGCGRPAEPRPVAVATDEQPANVEPLACWYELPKPQRDHFSFQVQAVAQMMLTGKPTYPVERTLLTTGLVDALLESRLKGHQRLETPELGVKYASS